MTTLLRKAPTRDKGLSECRSLNCPQFHNLYTVHSGNGKHLITRTEKSI